MHLNFHTQFYRRNVENAKPPHSGNLGEQIFVKDKLHLLQSKSSRPQRAVPRKANICGTIQGYFEEN